MLHLNTAPYAERCTVLPLAVWSHPARLIVCKGSYRDGLEWSTQVRECRSGEVGDLDAIDISTVLERFGLEHVDVLKMDVEGAERTIFSRIYKSWLDRVGCFVIELHDEERHDTFFQAIGREKYEVFNSFELTIARRVSPLCLAPVSAPDG
jgi:FkbM family methyltransferase